jgi:hypothetical protein
VANLLLSRAVARQREIAIRAAIGATRFRIVRQLLTESVLLAFCGGTLGVLFAFGSVYGIQVLGPKSVPRLNDIGVDAAALAFTALISLLSGIFFGLAPALRSSRVDVQATMKDASRGSAGAAAVFGRRNNLRKLLVISELALCAMLLIAAGLLIRSFASVQNVPPGFDPHNVLTMELTMSGPNTKIKGRSWPPIASSLSTWKDCPE